MMSVPITFPVKNEKLVLDGDAVINSVLGGFIMRYSVLIEAINEP
jgi:hypothetical protein